VNTWKIVLATLVIFVAGVVTGGLLVSYSDRAQPKRHRATPAKISNAMPKGLRMDFLQNLDREIDLTPEQRSRIEKIISEGQERNRQIWNRMMPELRREMQFTRERIRATLQPDQLPRFEELMKQSRPAGQRRSDDSMMQPDRRLRDQPRRPLPPREGPLPGNTPQPRPPVEQPANP